MIRRLFADIVRGLEHAFQCHYRCTARNCADVAMAEAIRGLRHASPADTARTYLGVPHDPGPPAAG